MHCVTLSDVCNYHCCREVILIIMLFSCGYDWRYIKAIQLFSNITLPLYWLIFSFMVVIVLYASLFLSGYQLPAKAYNSLCGILEKIRFTKIISLLCKGSSGLCFLYYF